MRGRLLLLRLADVQGLYPGLWYLRTGRISRSAAPGTGCMSISAEPMGGEAKEP